MLLLRWLSLCAVVSPGRPYTGPTEAVGPEPPADAQPPPPAEPAPPPKPATDPPKPVPDREPTPASKPADKPAERPRTWRVGASLDVGYRINSNFPDNHVYRGMVPTPRTGEFTPDVATVSVDHEPTPDEPWRVEVLLHAGAGVDALAEPEPLVGGADGRFAGAEAFKHIGLANVGLHARTGTSIDVGLMASPIGLEWFWPHRNPNQTASWVANGTPFYLMGARLAQKLPADVTLFAWVVNGWQTIGDLNKVPSYLGGASWMPTPKTTVAAMVYFGPEDVDPSPRAWRVHGDAFVSWDGKRLGLGAVWDAGREELTFLLRKPVAFWTGGAAFVRGRLLQRRRVTVDLAARPEAWWDRDGRIFGVDQWLVSATGTLSVWLFETVLARAEYRYDHSTSSDGFFFRREAIRDGDPGLATGQHTVLFALAAVLSHRFAARRKK